MPIGFVVFVLVPFVTAIIFGINLKNEAAHCSEASVKNEARIGTLEINQGSMQNNYGKMETKLDYLIQIIEELKKGIE